MALTTVPTPEEYSAEVNRLGDLIREANDARSNRQRLLVEKRQGSTCPGIRGWRVPGKLTECQAWKNDGIELWNKERPSYDQAVESATANLKNYQNSVIAVRDLENKNKIEQHMAEQAKLLEEQIAETFRVEAEKYMSVVSQANNVTSDQTLTQQVVVSQDIGYNADVVGQGKSNQQGLDGSFFPIMLLGVMLG